MGILRNSINSASVINSDAFVFVSILKTRVLFSGVLAERASLIRTAVVTDFCHPSLASASFDPPVRGPERPTGLHEVTKDPPDLCRIALGQEIVERMAQDDMGALDGGEIHKEVIGLSEGSLRQQELPAGSAQGFAGRMLHFLVFRQELVGLQRQGLDASEELVDTVAESCKSLLMLGHPLVQIRHYHDLTIHHGHPTFSSPA